MTSNSDNLSDADIADAGNGKQSKHQVVQHWISTPTSLQYCRENRSQAATREKCLYKMLVTWLCTGSNRSWGILAEAMGN